MRRRRFLRVISGLTIASIGSYTVFTSFQDVAEKIIESATSKLKIDNYQIDKFLAEAKTENYWRRFSGLKKEFIRIHYLLGNNWIPIPYSHKYLQYKNQIVGQFLLSTDFFINKMDADRKINYIGFYNPYKNPCSVPFSNIYYNYI